MKRTYAALALISIAFLAPEAWEAYALQEALTKEVGCDPVEVTCRCEVEVVEREQIEASSQNGYRVGVPYE